MAGLVLKRVVGNLRLNGEWLTPDYPTVEGTTTGIDQPGGYYDLTARPKAQREMLVDNVHGHRGKQYAVIYGPVTV